MYNYDVDVTYNDLENYQSKFLKVFDIYNFDNNRINKVFDYVFLKIKDDLQFKSLFDNKYTLVKDKWDLIPLLFSYQSFKYTHICLQNPNTENINSLEKSLKYLL